MAAGTLATSRNPWGIAMMQELQKAQPRSPSQQTAYSKWFDQRSDREARAVTAHMARKV